MTTQDNARQVRADVTEKLQAHYDELLASVRGKSTDDLVRRPAPGEWSALDQLEHHLRVEGIWTAMIERAVREDRPDLSELWGSLRRAEEPNPFPPPSQPRELDVLLAALSERHSQTLALLDSVPDESFGRVGRNTGFGDLSVLQMFRAVYRHYRMHIDQIEGREPSFQPRRAQP